MSAPQQAALDRAGLDRLHDALRAGLDRELPAAVELRHELHAAAELSGAEDRTASRVAAALGEAGAPAVAGTGRLVRIGPATGPCVAIRGELDALPVTERTGVPWSSKTPAMHACGHDVHLAALTALGRAAREVELPAALLAVLQPREETFPSGARDIVESGQLSAQHPVAVIGVHMQHQLPAGTIGAAAGTVNAATDEFRITVTGRGGHAGYPHLAVSPLTALCETVLALQQIPARVADPTHAVTLSVGIMQAGTAANVIPETASARGSLRTLSNEDRPRLHEALLEIVQNACRSYGCDSRVDLVEGELALVNEPDLTTACWPWLRQQGFTLDTGFRSCGADDFSHYAACAPTLMLFAGTPDDVTLHHPTFLPPDTAVAEVAGAMLAGYLGALSLSA